MSDCRACDRFVQSTWAYCPHCGADQSDPVEGDSAAGATEEVATDGGYVECTDKLCEGRAKWALWMPRREDFSRVHDPHPTLPYEDGDKHPYVCDFCLERYEWRHGHNGEFVRPEEKLVTDGGVPDPEAFRIPTIDELDAMRVEHGLSQRELSRWAGVEESRFHHILQHDVDPQTETMRSFLDVLQATEPQTEADLAAKRGPKPKPSPLTDGGGEAPTWADVDPEDYATDDGTSPGSIYPDWATCKTPGCGGEIVADGYCSECPPEDGQPMTDGGHLPEETEAATDPVGNAATGIDLFDEPLVIERGFVRIEGVGNDNSVDHEHRVEYDHDPPVEFDARFFGVMTELSVAFEWAGYRGIAHASVPNEELRAFIEAAAPHLGLSVERDREVLPGGGTVDLPPPKDGADPWCTWCDDDLEDEVWMIEGRDDGRWPSAFCSKSCAREWGCAADLDRVYRVEEGDEVVAR